MHTYTHIYTPTYTHTLTHVHSHLYTIHSHLHTYLHTNLHSRLHIHTHSHPPTYTHTFTHLHIYTYTQLHIHYTCIYTNMPMYMGYIWTSEDNPRCHHSSIIIKPYQTPSFLSFACLLLLFFLDGISHGLKACQSMLVCLASEPQNLPASASLALGLHPIYGPNVPS